MPVCSVVSFSATVEILIRLYRRGAGERRLDTAQTIGRNCGVTHSPGKIEYNCRYFLMTFRKRIRKNKFSKNGFHNLQGTMSHRPLTNASSLKITAAYYTYSLSRRRMIWLFPPNPSPVSQVVSQFSVVFLCVAGRAY
jgi:hypothetical protein